MFHSFHCSVWLIIIQASCLTFASPLKNTDSGLDAVLVLPLHSRAPTPGEYLDLPAIANHMRAKHGFPTVTIDTRNSEDSSSLQRRVNSNNVALFDDGPDLSYFATIKVGTPPKKFNVVLDTGSSDLFLSSSLCTKGCEETVIYDPSESKTSQVPGQAVNLKFGSVAVSGEVATDIVTLGGFSVNPQTFVMAKAIRGELLGQHVHGLMGLGFQSLAKTGHLTDSDGDAVPGGTLTLGDVNPQFFTGDIERHPVSTTNFWNIRLETITSQGVPIPVPSSIAPAIIDTGATLIAAPSSIFTTICQRMGGTPQTSGRLLGFCVIRMHGGLLSITRHS
ncbi:hypothetical protein Clacol_000366 [Clathrus columnatus]|uniref:Peptidase A1 domain-containing protein n=1 Tax=Clathrus columnatus TaxID=1419009 RepID=A0AAV4ZYL0_9AGAM|nr:hypothetical protein Clacol_000366 [Clathrus columnatus]